MRPRSPRPGPPGEPPPLGELLLRAFLAPGVTLGRVAHGPRPARTGALAVLALGGGWSLLSLVAHLSGARAHRPWTDLIPPERYYLFQALLLAPLLLGVWLAFGVLAHAGCRALGGRRLPGVGGSLGVCGLGLALPLLALFVLPDLGRYLLAAALGVRVPLVLVALSGALGFTWALALCAHGLAAAHGLTGPRAWLATLVALAVSGWALPLLVR